MKISKLFHWLYCAVMFLPLFVLPIFALAVRSDNNYQPIEVTSNEYECVNFNQRVVNGNFVDTSSWSVTNGSFTVDGNICTFVASGQSFLDQYNIPFDFEHKCVFSADIKLTSITTAVRVGVRNTFTTVAQTTDWQTVRSLVTPIPNDTGVIFFRVADNRVSNNDAILVKNCMVFDLTQMFGVGNEPSLEQFNTYFNNDYYSYTLSDNVLIDTGYIIYNDTDFGSQTIYTLYNEVDKYFNYDNVFNFGDLYTWLNTTFFSGSAPLGFFIFWHLLIYWLLTSLLWLLFDVLMYVPQLCHRWLDKASLE